VLLGERARFASWAKYPLTNDGLPAWELYQTVRYRLNRGGDRQLNRALHTIVLSRLVHHPETRAYAARRAAEGRTPREIKRCLKRHLARRLFKLLETPQDGA
jgi:hypothetical protein